MLREKRKAVSFETNRNSDITRLRQSPPDEEDESPQRMRMAPAYKTKFTFVKWSPIYKLLAKYCKDGVKWDDAWSDICQRIKADSVDGYDIRNRIKDLVTTNVVMKDGVPYDSEGDPVQRSSYFKRDKYYVDPDSGILKSIPHARKPKREVSSFFVKEEERLFAKDEEGVWHSFSWKSFGIEKPNAFYPINFSWEILDPGHPEKHYVHNSCDLPELFSKRVSVKPVFEQKFLKRFKDLTSKSGVPHFPKEFLRLGKPGQCILLKQLSKKEKKKLSHLVI